jgi:hypothetical protein
MVKDKLFLIVVVERLLRIITHRVVFWVEFVVGVCFGCRLVVVGAATSSGIKTKLIKLQLSEKA